MLSLLRQSLSSAPRDLTAGMVVSLVALPLCLGVALASGAPLFSGLIAGIVGGILVGAISGSHTSVSGPAAGLTAIVAAQIAALGSFEAFLTAVALAGLFQLALGFARAGSLARFFPSSVIKGLLAAIGIILILKQIPHVLGHDADPQGEMSFFQPDNQNTLTELVRTFSNLHPGAAAIGVFSVVLLLVWERLKPLKKSFVPAPLAVVLFGVAMNLLFQEFGSTWMVQSSHLVNVPVAADFNGFVGLLESPDFAAWRNPALYTAAVTIAMVASLETLLNLEAVDKIDPKQRHSPASRELIAQGVGNIACGFLGGIPVTSVIVRSSVNIEAGVESKLSTIVHGAVLLVSVALLPQWLNAIPLACLAAILFVTGFKLASPKLFLAMKAEGRYQFAPFLATVVSIVFTDLLSGVLVGLAVALAFILASNVRMPIRKIVEKHLGGEVVHIELADQVSFLNRAALSRELDRVPEGGQVLLDARTTDYIDPDVLDLIHDYKDRTAPARRVGLSLLGFHERYERLENHTQYVDYSSRSLQDALAPAQVLNILREGHARFRAGRRITRDLARHSSPVTESQHPLAVVLSCVDSRAPVELIFDLGLGDIFSVRVAGNVVGPAVLGSVEYACVVAGAKLVLVLGHTRCGAVTSAVELRSAGTDSDQAKGCQNLGNIVRVIDQAIAPQTLDSFDQMSPSRRQSLIDEVAQRNVLNVAESLRRQSQALRRLAEDDRILIVAGMYDVVNREIEFFDAAAGTEVPDS